MDANGDYTISPTAALWHVEQCDIGQEREVDDDQNLSHRVMKRKRTDSTSFCPMFHVASHLLNWTPKRDVGSWEVEVGLGTAHMPMTTWIHLDLIVLVKGRSKDSV